MKIEKLLVPVAFSPRCAWAARYAASLAAQFGAELVFLHADDTPRAGELEQFVVKEIGGAPHRCVAVTGDPADAIIAFTRVQPVDMILMPTHAHGKFRRFLLGSVTAKVLHDADCPVWTGVHQDDDPSQQNADLRTLVCAVDVDASSVSLIRFAQDLAATVGAKLRVIHAIPAADERSDNAGEIELRRFLFRQSREAFRGLLSEAGLQAEVELYGGKVSQVVREAALREHADLVVIGRGETQSGLGRLRTGVYGIIRESPCPVLSV